MNTCRPCQCVVDPRWVSMRIRIQHFKVNADLDPVPDPDHGFDDQQLKNLTTRKKLNFFIKKLLPINLSLGFYEGRPSCRRIPMRIRIQPTKTNADPCGDSQHWFKQ
jgi:hypothetical protein